MFGPGGITIMDRRIRFQLAEALGPTNRWFCSEALGFEVRDAELLLAYYIKNGGAEDFAKRYEQGLTTSGGLDQASAGSNPTFCGNSSSPGSIRTTL
jgi:hypothetical protein